MRRVGIPMRGCAAKDIYEDTPDEPKHTVKVLHLTPGAHLGLDELRRHVQERVDHLPVLRRKARHSRFAHAWWEEMPRLDVSPHIDMYRIGIGDDARNQAIAAELSRRLPFDRPLWRLRLLDASSGQTLVLSASHSLLDGFVAARVLEALFGPQQQAWPDEAEPLPSPLLEFGVLLGLFPRLMLRSARSTISKLRTPAARAAARPFSGAAGTWNQLLCTADRGYAEATFDLNAFRSLTRTTGATLTDVSVAMVGGALRALDADHESTDRQSPAYLAVVPMDTRQSEDALTTVNLLTYLFVDTGAHIAQPLERLKTVAASGLAAKARIQAGDMRLFADAWDLWPLLRATHQLSRWVAHRYLGRPPAAVVVSTVRGPAKPLSVAGVPIRSVVSGGVVTDDQGLNVTVWSCGQLVTFGVTGRPHLIDVAQFAQAIDAAGRELQSAVAVR